MSSYRQWLQVSVELVSDCLWTQEYITALDIGLNISSEAWPIVFGWQGLWFYWYRNFLLEGWHIVDWWALFKWLQIRTVVPSYAVPYRVLCTYSGLLPWYFELLYLTLAVPLASVVCHQCLPYKEIHPLAWYKTCPKTDIAGRAYECRRWGLDKAAIVWLGCWGLKG